jgi:hypothetical protein
MLPGRFRLPTFEHGLKSAVPNARMAALVRQCGVDFELTVGVEKALRSGEPTTTLFCRLAVRREWFDQ